MYEVIEQKGHNCWQVVIYKDGVAIGFYHAVHGLHELNRKLREIGLK